MNKDKNPNRNSSQNSRQNPKSISYIERAFDILDSVLRGGAYSNIALNDLLSQGITIADKAVNISLISESDKGKITNIVYGTLEKIYTIDFLLNKVFTKKPKPIIHNMLRLGAYLIIYFNSTAAYTVCNEIVELAKTKGKSDVCGFINASLRSFVKFIENEKQSIGSEQEFTFKSIEDFRNTDIQNYLATKYNYPVFAIKKIVEQFGLDEAIELLSYDLGNETHYRSSASEADTKQWFEQNGINYSQSAANVGYYVRHSTINNSKIDKNFANKYLTPQSLGSILICEALGCNSNIGVANINTPNVSFIDTNVCEASVLDVCAAPGGKSVYLASRYNADVTACDIYPHRVELIKSYASRMAVKLTAIQSDATVQNAEFSNKFDYVLVDAPCSGFGVVNKKPEIRLKAEADIKDLPQLQFDMLNVSANYVKVGGILLYSTCTLFDSENESVIKKFLQNNQKFVIEKIELPVKYRLTPDGFVYLLPHISHTEGFFMAKLKRIK